MTEHTIEDIAEINALLLAQLEPAPFVYTTSGIKHLLQTRIMPQASALLLNSPSNYQDLFKAIKETSHGSPCKGFGRVVVGNTAFFWQFLYTNADGKHQETNGHRVLEIALENEITE
jgi:hypothetical protein